MASILLYLEVYGSDFWSGILLQSFHMVAGGGCVPLGGRSKKASKASRVIAAVAVRVNARVRDGRSIIG